MISIDDKNYLLFEKDGTLKIHGSSLKGKHLPLVCDEFRDALCEAIFQKQDVYHVFRQFQNLQRFSIKHFQIRVYPSKLDYEKNTLYGKLLRQLVGAGLHVVAGTSLEYVKTVDGYRPVVLFSEQDRIDYVYYKDRLAEIASRILDKPAKALRKLFDSGQRRLIE